MKNLILSLLASSLLAACSAEVKGGKVADPEKTGTNQTGPFSIELPIDGASRGHQFEVDINQDSGSVQYFVTAARDMIVELTEATTTASGCDPKNVTTQVLWYPYGSYSNYSYYVAKNESFDLMHDMKGYLVVHFQGLSSCTKINFKTTLKEKI